MRKGSGKRLGRAVVYLSAAALIAGCALAASAGAQQPPEVKGVKPKTSGVLGGTTATVTGDRFVGVSEVRFGSVPAVSFKVLAVTKLVAVAPPHTAGTFEITVTTPGGTSPPEGCLHGFCGVYDHFKYTNPSIAEVSPNHGPVGGATLVSITGAGFPTGLAESTFEFGSVVAAPAECISIYSCTVLTPAQKHPGSQAVSVTVGGYRNKKSTAPKFTYE